MPKYLVSVSYSAEGAKGVRQDGGTKRREVATHAVESVGGKIEAFYFCFGDQDAIIIAELPDAASAAAVSLAVTSTGASSPRSAWRRAGRSSTIPNRITARRESSPSICSSPVVHPIR